MLASRSWNLCQKCKRLGLGQSATITPFFHPSIPSCFPWSWPMDRAWHFCRGQVPLWGGGTKTLIKMTIDARDKCFCKIMLCYYNVMNRHTPNSHWGVNGLLFSGVHTFSSFGFGTGLSPVRNSPPASGLVLCFTWCWAVSRLRSPQSVLPSNDVMSPDQVFKLRIHI